MAVVIVLGVCLAVGIGLSIAASMSKRKAATDFGMEVDSGAKAWLASLPLEIYRGWPEVGVEWAMSGLRHGRRAWLFELDLERGEAERELTGVLIEVADGTLGDVVSPPFGVEHVEVIPGYLAVFVRRLMWKELPEALSAADVVTAQMARRNAS